MATIVIEGTGISDADIITSILPRVSGCIGYYRYVNSLAQARRNWIDLSRPATVVGAPVIGADGARLTSMTNYFDLNLAETPAFTWFFVRKGDPITGSGSALFSYGGNDSQADLGAIVLSSWNSGLSQPAINLQCSGMVSLALPDPDPTLPALLCFTVDPVLGNQIHNLTSGVSGPLTPPSGTRAPIGRTLRSGSAAHPSFAGAGKLLIDARFNKALTLAEIAIMRQDIAADALRLNPAFVV